MSAQQTKKLLPVQAAARAWGVSEARAGQIAREKEMHREFLRGRLFIAEGDVHKEKDERDRANAALAGIPA